MLLRRAVSICLVGTALLLPRAARADGFFVPYYGAALGGSIDLVDDTRKPATWGACLGSMSGGVFGFETDVAFSPDFYADSDDNLLGANSVTTLMGNVLIGAPFGGQRGPGFRPYFAAGMGLIRQRVEGIGDLVEFSANNFGYNIGGGAFIFFGKSFGVRADFRYFRNLSGDEDSFLPSFDAGEFSFSRATAGLVFRF